jgi:threonine/homoserine/homoserine lactone efflux protein
MVEMWSTLAPLIIVSAALPLQIVVTLLLVRSSLRAAFSWVAGMTVARLIQGILFGVIFSPPDGQSETTAPAFVGGLLLVVAVLLYVSALRKALANEDEDAPPPKWIAKAESMPPLTAFAAGAGYIAINGKLWVLSLGAITAIADAQLGARFSILAFLVFVALAQSIQLAILVLATSSSSRSAALLEGLAAWIRRYSRVITVGFSVIFGTWFLFKALAKLGVL